jgi:hypothetical protein
MNAAVGRLLRHGETGWMPVGEPLPPFGHAPPAPQLLLAPWVLPKDLEPRAYDVIVVGELAHQLLTQCQPDDPIYVELAQQTMMFAEQAHVVEWLAQIEVWVGRRLDPGAEWPLPRR